MLHCVFCGEKHYVLKIQDIALCKSCAEAIYKNFDKLQRKGVTGCGEDKKDAGERKV